MTPAPILLFTYNRPLHTQKTVEALLQNELSSISELFIFSDGPKNNADKPEVEKTREFLHSIHGFGKIHIVENNENKGLAQNIVEGVTRIVNKYGKLIVLEDDLITSPYFLPFMNKALTKYENEERIGHIHAYCYPDLGLADTFLIKWTGSWGWATWGRSWNLFNPNGQALLNELERRNLTHSFDFNGTYPYTRMLRRQILGKNNSWAIRWNASLFLADKLSLNAGHSLVQNIGFDGSGTHSGNKEIYTTTLHDKHLLIDTKKIEEDPLARKAYEKYYRKTNSLWAKFKRRLLQ